MALIGVNKPREKAPEVRRSGGRFGSFLKLLGAGAGAIAGGAAGAAGGGPGGAFLGAAKGAAVGGTAGQFIGEAVDPAKTTTRRQEADFGGGQVGQIQSDRGLGAMSRRREELETDPLEALELAEAEAQSLPERERQLVLPKLTQARLLESRRRGIS